MKVFVKKAEYVVVLIVIITVLILYLLYINGFLIINVKSALFYVGTPRVGKNKNCLGARFSKCNGYIKRMIRLKPNTTYQFTYISNIEKGKVSINIYDKNKKILVVFDDQHSNQKIMTKQQKLFQFTTNYMHADGDYKLIWKELVE